jgi:hypothetical protein
MVDIMASSYVGPMDERGGKAFGMARTAILLLAQAILSVSQAVAQVSGGETGGSSPVGTNVKLTLFKWIIGAVVVIGLIRIVWRILKR